MRFDITKLTEDQVKVLREELAKTDHVAVRRSDLLGALVTSAVIGATLGAAVTAAVCGSRGQRRLVIED